MAYARYYYIYVETVPSEEQSAVIIDHTSTHARNVTDSNDIKPATAITSFAANVAKCRMNRLTASRGGWRRDEGVLGRIGFLISSPLIGQYVLICWHKETGFARDS
jgi:hypothetical protein